MVKTPDGATSLDETCAIRLDEVVADDYLDAQQRWQQHTGGDELDVIGQIGGRPLWAQGD